MPPRFDLMLLAEGMCVFLRQAGRVKSEEWPASLTTMQSGSDAARLSAIGFLVFFRETLFTSSLRRSC